MSVTLSEPVVIAKFPKNSRESVRVALDKARDLRPIGRDGGK